jgi:hypothetical protein
MIEIMPAEPRKERMHLTVGVIRASIRAEFISIMFSFGINKQKRAKKELREVQHNLRIDKTKIRISIEKTHQEENRTNNAIEHLKKNPKLDYSDLYRLCVSINRIRTTRRTLNSRLQAIELLETKVEEVRVTSAMHISIKEGTKLLKKTNKQIDTKEFKDTINEYTRELEILNFRQEEIDELNQVAESKEDIEASGDMVSSILLEHGFELVEKESAKSVNPVTALTKQDKVDKEEKEVELELRLIKLDEKVPES